MGSRSRARARAQVSESGNAGSRQRPDKPGNTGAAGRRSEPAAGPRPRPVSLLAAAAVQAIEAAGILVAAILAGMDAGSGRSYQVSSGVALTAIGIGTAAALGYVGYGLAMARPWSRTPALLTQLFAAIVGIYLVEGHRYNWGVPGLALAAVGFAVLLVPPSLRSLTREPVPAAQPRRD